MITIVHASAIVNYNIQHYKFLSLMKNGDKKTTKYTKQKA